MARKPSKAALEKRVEALKAKLAAEEAELKRIQEEEARQQAIDPFRVIACRAAAIAAIQALQAEDKDALPTVLVDLPVSSWPREKTLMRRFDVSETEAHEASQAGRDAIERLRMNMPKK